MRHPIAAELGHAEVQGARARIARLDDAGIRQPEVAARGTDADRLHLGDRRPETAAAGRRTRRRRRNGSGRSWRAGRPAPAPPAAGPRPSGRRACVPARPRRRRTAAAACRPLPARRMSPASVSATSWLRPSGPGRFNCSGRNASAYSDRLLWHDMHWLRLWNCQTRLLLSDPALPSRRPRRGPGRRRTGRPARRTCRRASPRRRSAGVASPAAGLPRERVRTSTASFGKCMRKLCQSTMPGIGLPVA